MSRRRPWLLAPSFNEVREQLAMSYEGLARVALARPHPDRQEATALLDAVHRGLA